MALTLMYITNDPKIAAIADRAGVDRVWIDLERLYKDERQSGMNTVKSDHTLEDIPKIKKVLKYSALQVRVNPINPDSKREIDKAIEYGAEIIMLPYFKTADEVKQFLDYVGGRAKTILLLETKEAVEVLDDIISINGIDEIHIGLNDLHLSYGMKFMFELVSDGTVDRLCKKIGEKGIPYGFGGIAKLGEGMVPAEYVLAEHYRLKSGAAILSRSFYNVIRHDDYEEIEKVFKAGVNEIRAYENELLSKSPEFFAENHRIFCEKVAKIVSSVNGGNVMKCIPFKKKVYLSSPTMHGEELTYMKQAYDTNWMSTLGENLDEIEKTVCKTLGCNFAVPLSTGTSAIHMAVKLAGVKYGEKVFCTDMTFAATVNPVVYEGGVPVFIDTDRDNWNMDPDALEKAFAIHKDVRVVVVAHLYGTPAKIDRIRDICDRHGAILIEDAAESLGATYKGKQTGTFGKYSIISFNGNKIITGSSGGMLITDDIVAADKVRKWSTQSRDMAPWYQHTELGYNYRMSNVIAGVVRGQLPHLYEHIAQKKAIYERYKEGFKDLPVSMNPFDSENSVPNYWLSCMLIDKDAMCLQKRSDLEAEYVKEKGKSCPTEILSKLADMNAEGRPIWKPMHLQPIYKENEFVNLGEDVGADIFERGLCLPSDNKMMPDVQDKIIEIVKSCF